jgi:hypothetical protein
MLESTDLLKVSTPTIYRSVHRVYTLFLLRQNVSVYDYQKRTLFTVNDSHNVKRAVGSFLRDASLGKQSEDYFLAEAQTFIFSSTRLLLYIRIILIINILY